MSSPIASVTPVTYAGVSTGAAVTNLPLPTTYEPSLYDTSAPDAGRNAAGTMNKMRDGQARDIVLEWTAPSLSEASAILSAFNSEYVLVSFLDPLAGAYVSRRFYVADRRIGKYLHSSTAWESLGFTIIQQTLD